MDPLSRLVAVETVQECKYCRTGTSSVGTASYFEITQANKTKYSHPGGDASNRSAENRLEVPNASLADSYPQPAMETYP